MVNLHRQPTWLHWESPGKDTCVCQISMCNEGDFRKTYLKREDSPWMSVAPSHGLGFQTKWKGEIQLSTTMHCWLTDCGCHVTTASQLWMPHDHCFLTVDVTGPLVPDCGCHVTTASWLWMPCDCCFLTMDDTWPLVPVCGCHVTIASWQWMPCDHCFLIWLLRDHCLMLLQLCPPCHGGLFLQAMSPKRPFLQLLLLGNLVKIRRQKQLIHKSHTLPDQV